MGVYVTVLFAATRELSHPRSQSCAIRINITRIGETDPSSVNKQNSPGQTTLQFAIEAKLPAEKIKDLIVADPPTLTEESPSMQVSESVSKLFMQGGRYYLARGEVD